ncbi:MAG: hypothetical protein IJU94_02750 [Clostridia bacterium]|nr:hypothetical protein [Clostridia bacterium]
MTKKKSAKRAFISSFMSFIMCFAMLAGTTFAWYTDSVTSSGNKIIAGTLDIELWMHDGNGYVDISASSAPIFQSANQANPTNATLWEPGKTQVAYLMIKNTGNLDLKYQVALNVSNVAKDLYKVMKFKIVPNATPDSGVTSWAETDPVADEQSVIVGNQIVSGTNVDANGYGGVKLEKGISHYFALLIHMDEEAGNEYMAGEVDFDLKVLATQVASESDSFGNTYDQNREFPVVSTGSTAITANTSEELTIEKTGEIESATVPAAAANALFEAMKDNEAESNELTLTLNVTKTGETITDTGTTVALEIDMTALMEKTKSGMTTTTSQGVTSFSDYVTIEYNLGKGLTDVTATHKGNAMVKSADTAVDNGNGVYSYNSGTGILTIKTKTLSPFTVSYTLPTADVRISKDGEEDELMLLAEFRNAVDEGNTYEGYTVTLLHDVDLGNEEWDAIGNKELGQWFSGIFDGSGYTVSNMKITNGTGDYEYSAFISGLKNGTVKNLTVTGTVTGENCSGIAARLDGTSKVENCKNYVNVFGQKKAGGVVCLLNNAGASVIDCENYGTITLTSRNAVANDTIGGVVSYANANSTISGCKNYGEVMGVNGGNSNLFIGGVVGYATAPSLSEANLITNCLNAGSVTKEVDGWGLGSVVGFSKNFTTSNLSNTYAGIDNLIGVVQ